MNTCFTSYSNNYEKQPSRGIADKFIGNEFEQLNAMKLPRSGEVHGRTSLTTSEHSDDSPQGEVMQKPHKSRGVYSTGSTELSFLTLINLFKDKRATIRKFRIVQMEAA